MQLTFAGFTFAQFEEEIIFPEINRNQDNQDQFKPATTIQAEGRIKKETVNDLKRGPATAFLKGVYLDGRLESLQEILKFLEKEEGNSCPLCWSFFDKLGTVSIEVLDLVKKGQFGPKVKGKKPQRSKKKGKGEVAAPLMPPQRELGISTINGFAKIMGSMRNDDEIKGIKTALGFMVKELREKRNRTPGAYDYFVQLADMIEASIKDEDIYLDDWGGYREEQDLG
jgi:hypothetical protein